MRFPATLGAVALLALCVPITKVAAEPGVDDNRILLGGSNALTGAVAAGCAPATYWAKAWFDKVNREGGVHGPKIEYNVLDDGYSAHPPLPNSPPPLPHTHLFPTFR